MAEYLPVKPARLSLIVARARNGVIGQKGALPWRLRADLQFFKSTTLGKPVIMGRKTWDSLPRKPLAGRPNFVISRHAGLLAPGARVLAGLDTALAAARAWALVNGVDEVCLIGGASLYDQAFELADRLYLTEVDAEPEGDVRLDLPDLADWRQVSALAVQADEGNDHAFVIRTLDRPG